jgi:hypothetical protein
VFPRVGPLELDGCRNRTVQLLEAFFTQALWKSLGKTVFEAEFIGTLRALHVLKAGL